MPGKSLRAGCVLAIMAAFAAAQVDSVRDARETVSRYCSGCHNERARVAGLVLNSADISGDPAVWEKVVRKLRMRAMPPLRRSFAFTPQLANTNAAPPPAAPVLERSHQPAQQQ